MNDDRVKTLQRELLSAIRRRAKLDVKVERLQEELRIELAKRRKEDG